MTQTQDLNQTLNPAAIIRRTIAKAAPAQTPTVPQPTAANSDWKHTAGAQLEQVIATLMESKPDPTSEAYSSLDPASAQAAYSADLGSWTTHLSDAMGVYKTLQLGSIGLQQLPDGTTIATGDMTPEQQQQVELSNKNNYNDILNKYGLSQFSAAGQATDRANQIASQTYQDKMTNFDKLLGMDQLSLQKATGNLARWNDIQTQAGNTATNVLDAQKAAIPYGTTNGKTNFSGADLGSVLSAFAHFTGVDPNSDLIKYPGVTTMDPAAVQANAATAAGGGGAAPTLDFPTLATQDQLPQTPDYQGGPSAPNLIPPSMLTLPPQLQKVGTAGTPSGMRGS